ncbi:Mce protein [Mycobacteriaceae bacterium NPDC060252]
MTGYPAPPGGQLRIVLASLMVGVAVVALCACGLLAWKRLHDGPILAAQREMAAQEHDELNRDRQIREFREQARDAAESVTVILTSVDSGNVDENFAQILERCTGELKDEFTKGSVQLRQLLIDNKASAAGKVVASAVQSDTADKPEKSVVILLAVDQSITNSVRPDPRIDRSRMKMTMELVDGRWLASKLEYI